MNLPTTTKHEIEFLKRILKGEGNFKTIEEREQMIKLLRYNISEVVITLLLNEAK